MAFHKTSVVSTTYPAKSCNKQCTPVQVDGDDVYYTGPNLPSIGVNTNDDFNTVVEKIADTIEDLTVSKLIELNETFENLISGSVLTITNHQADDIVLVHRNGLFRRPNQEYMRSGPVITFQQPFGSSTGTLGDGEVVSIVSLRQT